MRATHAGRHLSGAERLVYGPLLSGTVTGLVARAQEKRLPPDAVTVTIELVNREEVSYIRSLDLIDHRCADRAECRAIAFRSLVQAGVSGAAVAAAMDALDRGPAPSGGNMRGAMIMDARTGERLEPDQERGIRASRFDWSEPAAVRLLEVLTSQGLTHVRTREALALASKVSTAPAIVAELCWSDDPDYTAGYVAVPSCGYHRLPFLKQPGIERGGRAFFVDRATWTSDDFQRYLQEVPVIINAVGTVRSDPDAGQPCREVG